MKRIVYTAITILVIVGALVYFSGCSGCGQSCSCPDKSTCINNSCSCKSGACLCDSIQNAKAAQAKADNPNVMVYIDLSDRLEHSKQGMDQKANDIDLTLHIYKSLHSFLGQNLKGRKGSFKVFFYPAPTYPEMNAKAKELNVNFGDTAIAQKPKAFKAFNTTLKDNLSDIYDAAISQHKYVGSDIWGFFEKSVDAFIKEDARNILVILTDGYIYHENNKGAGKFIMPSTLAAGQKLTPAASGLNDLEVIFLEVNEQKPGDFGKMNSTIGEWLSAMGVSKYQVVQHDLPANNYTAIDKFLNF